MIDRLIGNPLPYRDPGNWSQIFSNACTGTRSKKQKPITDTAWVPSWWAPSEVKQIPMNYKLPDQKWQPLNEKWSYYATRLSKTLRSVFQFSLLACGIYLLSWPRIKGPNPCIFSPTGTTHATAACHPYE